MKEISLSKEDIEYFKYIMNLLGNKNEIYDFSTGNIQMNEDIIFNSVFYVIKMKNDDKISFILSNFQELYVKIHDDIISLDGNIIERIIKNHKFLLKKMVYYLIFFLVYMKNHTITHIYLNILDLTMFHNLYFLNFIMHLIYNIVVIVFGNKYLMPFLK